MSEEVNNVGEEPHSLEQTQESAEAPHLTPAGAFEQAQRMAAELIAYLDRQPEGDLVGEIVDNGLKILRDQINRGDIKLINRAMKEIRYALKVFAPYRQFHKVSIFGSARTAETDPDYVQCAEFARRMVEKKWMVITGAGGGIMAAGHGGAGPQPSFGLAIRLPFEQATNVHIARDKKLINFKYFFTRKLMFVRSAHGVALFPGGFGTLDEGFEVLTLVQTGKSAPMPIVFIDSPGGGYWRQWLEYAKDHLLARRFINHDDLRLFKVTDNLDVAVHEMTHFYSNYHSTRTVKEDLVLRVQRAPTTAQLAEISARFGEIARLGGTFRVSAPLPAEADEPTLSHLARLVFPFNWRDHGKLRILIDYLNDMEA